MEGTDHPFPVLSVPRSGGEPDTLASLYLAHDRVALVSQSRGNLTAVAIFQQPFADITLWAVQADGRGIVLVDRRIRRREEAPTYGVVRVTLDGDTVFSVRRAYSPLPIPPELSDSIVERYADDGPGESEVRRMLFLPGYYPPVSRLLAGSDGSVWVAREAPPDRPVTWDVFSPDGTLAATFDTPAGLVVHWTDGRHLWGVETDELDVPYAVLYDVGAGGGP